MNDPLEKYALVWSWKLHTDTGEHMPELPPIIENGKEVRYFKVKGSKRPAIVWTSNSETAKLIMLTTQKSIHVQKLGDIGTGEVSYVNPDKKAWERYPYRLIESGGNRLSDGLQQLLSDIVNKHSMSTNPPGTSS